MTIADDIARIQAQLDALKARAASEGKADTRTRGERIAERMVRGRDPYPIAMFTHDAPIEPPQSTLLGSVPAVCSLSCGYCQVTLERSRIAIASAIDSACAEAVAEARAKPTREEVARTICDALTGTKWDAVMRLYEVRG